MIQFALIVSILVTIKQLANSNVHQPREEFKKKDWIASKIFNIINGYNASSNIRFFAVIFSRKNISLACGGSVIDDYWIMTSAQCVKYHESKIYSLYSIADPISPQSWYPIAKLTK